jgi:hypothetical protein
MRLERGDLGGSQSSLHQIPEGVFLVALAFVLKIPAMRLERGDPGPGGSQSSLHQIPEGVSLFALTFVIIEMFPFAVRLMNIPPRSSQAAWNGVLSISPSVSGGRILPV